MIRYVNVKTVVVSVVAISAILAGVSGSFARPEYLTSFDSVYGNGSCGTCHIRASGGGPLNSYGTLFQDQPNHVADASAALKAIGSPSAATETAETLAVTTVTATKTQPAPGFGFVISLIGLFSWALLARRHNK